MKILLIEDDATLSQNVRDALSSENYSVDMAFDGLLAEKFLKKANYDCIILDINLPGRNGYDVCKEFRKYNNLTPVLMLTAFDELEDKVKGFDCGADDYLTKPFYMKELLLRIGALIKRRSNTGTTETSENILFEDVVVNQKNKSVKRNGQEILLTPREYQILIRLASAKGELVTKKDLLKEIWGGSFEANTNTIEVYINFLRKKFDKPFEKQLIKTKVGYGYFLDL